jgi:hypothetical protein
LAWLGSGDGQVQIRWDAMAGATSYTIYYRAGADFASIGEADGHSDPIVGQTQGTVAGLTNGTQYYLRVTASNAAGESGLSALPVTATPHLEDVELPLDTWVAGKIMAIETEDWFFFNATPGTVYRVFAEDGGYSPNHSDPLTCPVPDHCPPDLDARAYFLHADKTTPYVGLYGVSWNQTQPFVEVNAAETVVRLKMTDLLENSGTYWLRVEIAPPPGLVLDHTIDLNESASYNGFYGLSANGDGSRFVFSNQISGILRSVMNNTASDLLNVGFDASLSRDTAQGPDGRVYFHENNSVYGLMPGGAVDQQNSEETDWISGLDVATVGGVTRVYAAVLGDPEGVPAVVPPRIRIYGADLATGSTTVALPSNWNYAIDLAVDSQGLGYVAGVRNPGTGAEFVLARIEMATGTVQATGTIALSTDSQYPSWVHGMDVDEVHHRVIMAGKREWAVISHDTNTLAETDRVLISGHDAVGGLGLFTAAGQTYVGVGAKTKVTTGDGKWDVLVYRIQ